MTKTTNANIIPVSQGASFIPWYPEYAREIDGWIDDSCCKLPLILIKAVTMRPLLYDMFLLVNVEDEYKFPLVNVVSLAEDGLFSSSTILSFESVSSKIRFEMCCFCRKSGAT